MKKLRLGEWTENTRTEHEAALKMFAQIFGDKPIGMYEKADGRRFKDVLLRLPSNAHKKPQFKDLTLLEAAEKADGISGLELLSPVTINKLIRKVSAFFSYCMSAFEECNSNPMAGQTDRTRQIQAEDRDPFTLTQLQTIFSSPIYHGCKSEARWYEPGSVQCRRMQNIGVSHRSIYRCAPRGNRSTAYQRCSPGEWHCLLRF